jgi:lipopolysaccharide heptosyltransferase I
VNILIVKLSALGDVTHTLPALTALRRAHPDARISWLIEEQAEPIVAGHPALNRVLVWRRRQFTDALRRGRLLQAAGLVRGFIRQLRDTRYDLVIDFQALLKSGVWVGLARATRKAGFGPGLDHSEGSYLFLNHRVPAVSMEIHALDRGLMLLEALGIPRGPVVYDFPITDDARARVERALQPHGIDPQSGLVAMHAMTRWETKQWLPERFGEVADAIAERGCRVVFTGAAQDRAALDAIAASMRHPAIRLDGQLDLKALAALLQRANVVVSTDTGPMHIAAAVGTPVVALFGPTSPQRTGPHGSRHVVLRAGVACSPCFSRSCRSSVAEPMACMRRLEARQVIDAVVRLLPARIPTRNPLMARP